MKWNIALVLFLASLLTIRYLLINDRFATEAGQQKIRIMPLIVKEEMPENTLFTAELLSLDDNKKTNSKNEDHQKLFGTTVGKVKSNGGKECFLQVTMHDSKPFVTEKSLFLPSDRIYVSLVFPKLKAGKYNIVSHWQTPWGTIARKTVKKVNLSKDAEPYRAYFWFQLVENSMFTKLFTGDDYKKKVYGQWEVLFYLDEEKITSKPFIVAKL